MSVEVLKEAIGKPLKGYEDRPQWEVDLFLVMGIYALVCDQERLGFQRLIPGEAAEVMDTICNRIPLFTLYPPEKPGDHWAYRAPEVVKHYIDGWGKMAAMMGLEPIASWAKPK